MADKVVTAASVLASATATIQNGTAGAAITAGDVLAKDTDGTLKLADANGVAPLNKVAGIALHSSLTGQPVAYAVNDPSFTPGISIAAAEVVVLSATPGKMAPVSDEVTGWYGTVLGIGIGSSKMNLRPLAAGAPVP